MKMQLMNETLRYDVLNNETILYKLIETKLFISKKFTISKFIKTSPSVLPGCGTRTKLICIMHPNRPHTVVGETPHSTH